MMNQMRFQLQIEDKATNKIIAYFVGLSGLPSFNVGDTINVDGGHYEVVEQPEHNLQFEEMTHVDNYLLDKVIIRVQ